MKLTRFCAFCILLVLLPTLTACGSTNLLTNTTPNALVLDRDGGAAVNFSYRLGKTAEVWVVLQNAQGQQFPLREGQVRTPSSDPYTLRFDGTAPVKNDPEIVQRALPSGDYTYTIQAKTDSGEEQTSSGTLSIRGGDVPPPQIQNLTVSPQIVSPNADGVDDQAEITYQLPVTATVDLSIARPDGGPAIPIITGEEQDPTPQTARWDGKTSDGAVLPNGVYTYTLRVQDDYGNIAQRSGPITIADSGQPEATITYSNIAPARIELGDVITVTLRIKNTGDVPIRTYGPPSGYEYSTNQVFSSIEDGQYVQKSGGFWRVGLDWDGNTSAGPRRYPYRWAISPRPPEQWQVPFKEDVLKPGEEAEVIGLVKVDQPENKMGFYVGLTWDGVGFRQDRVGRQIVEVGF